jgi:predicted nucleic acid-binding protein
MPYLIDTNIFLRVAKRNDPERATCLEALQLLAAHQEDLCYTTQTLVEFWNVCTRPASARGGLGLSLQTTERKVRLIEKRFRILPESAATHQEWRRLVSAHAVEGVQVHDTMLVAVMTIHKITHLLTYNKGDFKRFAGVTAVTPAEVMQALPPVPPPVPAAPPPPQTTIAPPPEDEETT